MKAHTGYQALRAARARSNGETSDDEAKLVEVITVDTSEQFEVSISLAAGLVKDLTRELRIIAELPGRAALPLSKKRRASKASQLTCQQLLDSIQPLADSLNPPGKQLHAPAVSCVPEGIDLDQYLHVLRWFIEDDESLSAIAFAYEPGTHNFAGIIPAALGARVDATWSALKSNRRATVIDKIATPTLVAVTDRRIISASPRSLAHQGEIRDSVPLGEVQFVRTQSMQANAVRPTVDIITADRDVRWMFPEEADPKHIDLLSQVIDAGMKDAQSIRSLPEEDPEFDSNRLLSEVEATADN
ncbi:MAG: hypothetical protein L0H71_09305 [Yaniella sp.]|nr:hypothetical protein [Yaniella sp.]